MMKKVFLLSAIVVNMQLCGSAGSAAASAGKTSLVGSGGVQELMEQQSACMVSGTSERPWEFRAGKRPSSVAFSPDGKLLAVVNCDSKNVSVYTVAANGRLVPLQGSPFAVGQFPQSAVFSPDGKLLVVPNRLSDNVSVYTVIAKDKLVQVQDSPFAAGQRPESAVFSPDGKLLAVPNLLSNNVSVYRVDTDGILEPVQDSPFAAGQRPESAAFSPDGKLLAVTNSSSWNVSVYTVAAGGILAPVQGSPFSAGQGPKSAVFSPDGKLLAVANFDSISMYVYTVANDRLMPAQGSPFTGGPSLSVVFSPDGKLLVVPNVRSNNVSVYTVDVHGRLLQAQGWSFLAGNKNNPRSAVFSPDGKLLAVSNGLSGNVSVYTVDVHGRLMPAQGSPFPAGEEPRSVVFSPDGKLLAVANSGDNTIWMYEVDPDTGAISPITGGELKATKRVKEQYEEAHRILVEKTPPILNKDIVENVLQGFIVGEQPVKKQEKQDKNFKESDDAIQQKIKRTKEQEASREQDQAKLFEAIKKDDEKGVAEYLTPFTVNAVNEKDEFRGTPLLAATRADNASIVKKILDYQGEIVREDKVPYGSKANLMAKDKDGNTALLSAIFNNKDYNIALMIAQKMNSEERKRPIKDGFEAIVYVERFPKTGASKADYEKLIKLLQE